MDMLWKAIEVSFETPRSDGGYGIPLMFWGSPGIGKSSIINQVSKSLNVALETVILSIRDPSDIGGLPVKTANGVVFEPPIWAKNIVKSNGGIVFFDELNCSASAVQASALRVICEGYVGELKLPKNTLMIAACNPIEQGTNTTDLGPSLSNRFCHIELEPSPDLFSDWLKLGKSLDISTKRMNMEDWQAEYANVSSVVSEFISRNSGRFIGNFMDRSFASPRTWDMACRLWTTCRCKDYLAIDFISGCIGEGVTNELLNFYAYMDLPDPRVVLNRGVSSLPDMDKIDRVYACINSVLGYTIKYPEHAPKFCKILKDLELYDIVNQCTRELINNTLCNSEEALSLIESLEI